MEKKTPPKKRTVKKNDKKIPNLLHLYEEDLYKEKLERAIGRIDFTFYDGLISEMKTAGVGGLDFSLTAPALCVIDKKGTHSITVKCDKEGAKIARFGEFGSRNIVLFDSHADRLGYIYAVFDRFLEEHPIKTLYVEGYSYGAKGMLLDIAEATGAILFALALKHRFEIYKIPPSVIKGKIGGSAVASKQIIWYCVCKILPHQYQTYDESDAASVALVGYQLHQKNFDTFTASQRVKTKKGKIVKWA